MEKTKQYLRTPFSADVLREAIAMFDQVVKGSGNEIDINNFTMNVNLPGESWSYDNLEEFFSEYRKAIGVQFERFSKTNKFKLNLRLYHMETGSTVSVRAPIREQIETIFEVFEKHFIDNQLPELVEKSDEKEKPTIFIGHGHCGLWRDLKDHLHEQHGYSVQVYETGARAGHVIRDIIQDLASTSTFAVLILTCDDDIGNEKYRARQNVVHEAGLFQGYLGFTRAIVLLEAG